jgi:hypothetical protein
VTGLSIDAEMLGGLRVLIWTGFTWPRIGRLAGFCELCDFRVLLKWGVLAFQGRS